MVLWFCLVVLVVFVFLVCCEHLVFDFEIAQLFGGRENYRKNSSQKSGRLDVQKSRRPPPKL